MNALFSSFATPSDANAVEVFASLAAAIREKDVASLTQLLSSGVKPAALNYLPDGPGGLPLLLLAAMHDLDDAIDALLAAKADVDITDATGATACYVAARNDASKALDRLITGGANMNMPRHSGATPLYIAAQNDSRKAVKLLCRAGADLEASKEGGFSPVHIATLRNCKECLQLLVESGADVNRAYAVADRFTPTMLAAHINGVEAMGVLLQAGAEIGAKDEQGRTAQEIAQELGHDMIVSMLDVRLERQQRDTQMAMQEGTLQELRHLAPVQADLEVESSRMEALQLQAAKFRSEVL